MEEIKRVIVNLWNSLPLQRKAYLAASIIFVATALALVVFFSSQPKFTLLFGNLQSAEASKIIEELQNQKIPYQIGDNGKSIMVPQTKVHEVRMKLAAQGIPRVSDAAGGVGFELFDKSVLGMSDFMQKANYYRALQGELARTIKELDEVKDARVMIVVPEERLFSQKNKRESKASVFLQMESGRRMTPQQVEAIRFLVSNGVEGLQPHRVAVVDSAGRSLAEDQDSSSFSNLSKTRQSMIHETENTLLEKAQTMLDQVLGPGQSVVRITVDMDFDSVERESVSFDPKVVIPRTETITNDNSNSKTESLAGAAGTTQNVPEGKAASASSPTTSSTQTKENTVTHNEINSVKEKRQRAVGDIRRLTAAVTINKAKPSGGGKTKDRDSAELKKIEELVKQAIGFTQSTMRQDSIKVEEVEFVDMFTGTDEKKVPVDVNKMLPYASQGLLIVLAVAVLFYFRSIINSSDKGGGEPDFSELLERYESLQQQNSALPIPAISRSTILSVDDVSKMIEENPSTSAQAIRQWMNQRS